MKTYFATIHDQLNSGVVLKIEKHPKSNCKVMITAQVNGENLQAMSHSIEDCLIQISEFIEDVK